MFLKLAGNLNGTEHGVRPYPGKLHPHVEMWKAVLEIKT